MMAVAVLGTVFVVYLDRLGDLPPPLGASHYSIGQLAP